MNAGGTITNSGTITGSPGIINTGGSFTLTNTGAIIGTGGAAVSDVSGLANHS